MKKDYQVKKYLSFVSTKKNVAVLKFQIEKQTKKKKQIYEQIV